MKITTKLFGEIEAAEDKIIEFSAGIIGFPKMQHFLLIHDIENEKSRISWLQSVEEPEFAMPVIDPLVLMEDYDPLVEDEMLSALGDLDSSDMLVLVTVTVPADIRKMTANFKAPVIINAVEAHHGDVEAESLIACIVQAADAISAARPGARRETLETYTNRLKQLEEITNSFKGVDKSFAIQAGREVRIMVIPEQVSDDDMVLMAREISKRIEDELEYPGQIKVNVIRESRVTDYAK